MPDTQEMLSYLGLTSSTSELVKYMDQQGINLKSELFLEKDEYGNYDGFDAYLEMSDDGFCLVFTDEAEFLGMSDQPAGKGELYFSTVFFHSEGKDGYREYKGTLPFGLSFNDKRKDVITKLGEQSWQRLARDGSRVISDRWDNLSDVPYRLHVTYSKDTEKVSIISASLPDKPLT